MAFSMSHLPPLPEIGHPEAYYARLSNGRKLPVMVVEGGWTSGSAGAIQSSLTKQARYLRRQERLLDSAGELCRGERFREISIQAAFVVIVPIGTRSENDGRGGREM